MTKRNKYNHKRDLRHKDREADPQNKKVSSFATPPDDGTTYEVSPGNSHTNSDTNNSSANEDHKSSDNSTEEVAPAMSNTTRSMTSILDEFIHNINSLSVSYDIISSFTRFLSKHNGQKFSEFLQQRGTPITVPDEEVAYTVPIFWRRTADKLQSNYDKLETARSIVPESLLVSLVSQYDAFLGSLVRNLFYLKPELLNDSERVITFKELMSYDDLEKAREHIINEELNTLLRKSHHEQFLWLENKLSIQLRQDLAVYPSFIELTERRNLLVHAQGVVSSQYLEECKKHSSELSQNIKQGSKLDVDREYFGNAAKCLIELAIKLAHVTFRKLEKDTVQRDFADSKLNSIIPNSCNRKRVWRQRLTTSFEQMV